ncbi:MAG TPA: hypothetical protein VKY19_06965 [Ktedonosporobacter sp.]|jgi:hypothetical protein|nr:hypothetical protein [Ktedonosporobacter sp.]
MPEQIKLLTSRRAYEFHADDLRLSTLSLKPIQEQIQQLFHFQSSTMGTPIPTFGDVPATYPPGFVFNMGVWLSPEQQIIPIRFLHFEQRRVVIDVAGPSTAITAIYEQLLHFLHQMQAGDGSPIIGQPERILDYSEITSQLRFSIDEMFISPLRKLFTKTVIPVESNQPLTLVPTLALGAYQSDQELHATPSPNEPQTFTLTFRVGTRPEEKIYFSAAPLDSETHRIYLSDLEAVLASAT